MGKNLAKEWLKHPQLSRVTKVLEENKDWPQLKMEIFPGDKTAVERIDKAIEALKIGAGYLDKNNNFINCFADLEIEILYQGGEVDLNKPIISIAGKGGLFLHLEDLLLNILSGNTEIESGKIGTPFVSISSMQEWPGLGSLEFEKFCHDLKLEIMPNSLTAIYKDPVKAAIKFSKWNSQREEMYGIIPVIELNESSASLALKLARRTAPQLYGICLHYKGKDPSLEQIRKVRKALDNKKEALSYIKLLAMGSFVPEKCPIHIFIKEKPNNCWARISQ